jgi:hypothetical protein
MLDILVIIWWHKEVRGNGENVKELEDQKVA